MELLEIKYFGGSQGPMHTESSKYDTIDARQPSPLKLDGDCVIAFDITRSGATYNIKVVNDTSKKQRYNLVCTNELDHSDQDYLSIP